MFTVLHCSNDNDRAIEISLHSELNAGKTGIEINILFYKSFHCNLTPRVVDFYSFLYFLCNAYFLFYWNLNSD